LRVMSKEISVRCDLIQKFLEIPSSPDDVEYRFIVHPRLKPLFEAMIKGPKHLRRYCRKERAKLNEAGEGKA